MRREHTPTAHACCSNRTDPRHNGRKSPFAHMNWALAAFDDGVDRKGSVFRSKMAEASFICQGNPWQEHVVSSTIVTCSISSRGLLTSIVSASAKPFSFHFPGTSGAFCLLVSPSGQKSLVLPKRGMQKGRRGTRPAKKTAHMWRRRAYLLTPSRRLPRWACPASNSICICLRALAKSAAALSPRLHSPESSLTGYSRPRQHAAPSQLPIG